MLALGRWLNPRWDVGYAEDRLRRLGVPLDQRVDRLSGGQQAQLALAMALGKRPQLLVLDEPVANLDPLARREFLQVLMEEVAGSGVTVLLSSHLMADLERVCDYLVLLSAARVQLAGQTEELLATHALLSGPRQRAATVAGMHSVVQASYTDRQASLLVRVGGPVFDPAWTVGPVTLEELVLAYMRQPDASATSRPVVSPVAAEVSA